MTVAFMHKAYLISYEAYLISYDFLKVTFSHFTHQVRLFFVEERKPKIFGLKNMKRGIRKILIFVIR